MKSICQVTQSRSSPMFSEIKDSQQIFMPDQYKFGSDTINMQIVFPKESQYQQTKTYLNMNQKLGVEQLDLITMKIIHKNVIGLRKIGKSKKPGEQNLYWLYYEPVQFSLTNYLTSLPCLNYQKTQEKLLKILFDIKNLMSLNSVYAKILWENIGVNALDIIKIYIPAEELINSLSKKSLQLRIQKQKEFDNNVSKIISKFRQIASKNKTGLLTPQIKIDKNQEALRRKKQRKTEPSNNQRKNEEDQSIIKDVHIPRKADGVNKFQKIRNDLEKIKLKIKSGDQYQASRGNSPSNQTNFNTKVFEPKTPVRKLMLKRTNTLDPSSSNEQYAPRIGKFAKIDQKKSMICDYKIDEDLFQVNTKNKNNKVFDKAQKQKEEKIHQQNINCINIYHTNHIVDSKVYPIKQKQPKISEFTLKMKENYNKRQFDEDSCDTYQMELGQNFQMPNLNSHHKLRQTALPSKDRWDATIIRSKGKNAYLNIEQQKSIISSDMKKKVYQSAGRDFFHHFREANQEELEKDEDQQIESTGSDLAEGNQRNQKKLLSESRTLPNHKILQNKEKSASPRNWQSSTIKTLSPVDIKNRVQEALQKTRSAMIMLKTPKSNLLGK